MFDIVKSASKTLGCEVYENAPMSNYTTFKTGGTASLLVIPGSVEALCGILSVCRENSIKTYVIGNGSNILVSDNGLYGVVIRISSAMSKIDITDENTIVCESGISMSRLCSFALKHCFSGLEFAYGIPGTAGGAAYMNAGAYGGEMKDVLVSCKHISPNGDMGEFSGGELSLGYRKSVYSDSDYIITSLKLRLENGNYDEIKSKMDENFAKRKLKQPLEYPSAGSAFKRPEGYFAGALIEQCGLKGCSVGGAEVSQKHAGFVINKGGATSSDILALIKHIQKTVFEETGVMLEPEIKYFE